MVVDRLTALDRLMLWTSRRWPQDVGALAILDGGPLLDQSGRLRLGVVRGAIESRLHLVPRFRQLIYQPRRGLGGPAWVDARTFDVTQHVRELPVGPPAGELELLAAVEGLLHRRLDWSRPLWEMWFLTGLPERQLGVFVRIHHTIADGIAAMATVATFLDPAPDAPARAPEPPRWRSAPWPSAATLFGDNVGRRLRGFLDALKMLARPQTNLGRLRTAWPALRELIAEEPATETSLDRMVGPRRDIALIRCDLNTVRRAGRAHGATVNDVLLTALAGGLRSLLRSRGEPVEDTTVRVYVPVTLRRRWRGPQHGNQIAQMAVPLHLGLRDPERRLRQVAAETTIRKARARTSLDALLHGRLLRRLVLVAVMRQRVNATIASIPGPRVPLYLVGARVLEVFPVPPLVANEPLAVGALSYAGTLAIGVNVDRDAYPDLDVLAAAMRDELEAMGIPTNPGIGTAGEGEVREQSPGLAAGALPVGSELD